MDIAKIVFELLELRHGLESDRRSAALDFDRQRLAGADADDALHVGEAFDFLAIDREHQIARLEIRRPPPRWPVCTVSTRALVVCLPTVMKMAAKMAIASTKFAIGPAATTAAREPTGWNMKAVFPIGSVIDAAAA